MGLSLKPRDPADFVQTVQTGSFQGLLLVLGCFGNLPPAMALQALIYRPELNVAGLNDDAYTQLVSQVVTATAPSQQSLLYAQLNDYWLDQAWALPVVQNPPHLAARANVRGLRYDAHEALVVSDVWLA